MGRTKIFLGIVFLALCFNDAYSQTLTSNAKSCNNCNGTNAICEEKIGYVVCSCKPGFIGNGLNCTRLVNCDTYSCCPEGYVFDFVKKKCADINECNNPSLNKCDPASCTNKNGIYLCGNSSGTSCNGSICPSDQDCMKIGTSIKCADPCINHQELNGVSRLSTINSTGRFSTDRYYYGWFRYTGSTGLRMQEGCVDYLKCGSLEPLSLGGQHPAIGEGIKSKPLKINSLSGCINGTSIPVKACPGRFYVYKFSGALKFDVYCTDPTPFNIFTNTSTTMTTTEDPSTTIASSTATVASSTTTAAPSITTDTPSTITEVPSTTAAPSTNTLASLSTTTIPQNSTTVVPFTTIEASSTTTEVSAKTTGALSPTVVTSTAAGVLSNTTAAPYSGLLSNITTEPSTTTVAQSTTAEPYTTTEIASTTALSTTTEVTSSTTAAASTTTIDSSTAAIPTSHTTADIPITTAIPNNTTTAVSSSTAAPSTTTDVSATTTAAPSTTAVPSTSAETSTPKDPSTTTVALSTTTAAQSTTLEATTTTEIASTTALSTTTEVTSSTTAAASTTTIDSSTAAIPTSHTTADIPITTAIPNNTTTAVSSSTAAPSTTTDVSATTTAAPSTTAVPSTSAETSTPKDPSTTTVALSTTTAAQSTTLEATSTTIDPSATTITPSTTTAFSVTITAPTTYSKTTAVVPTKKCTINNEANKKLKLKISVYSNSKLTNLLYSSQRISPGAPLYVVLEAQDTDGEQDVLLVNSFFASKSKNPKDTNVINNFVKDGYLADDKYRAIPISGKEPLKKIFQFNAFRFSDSDQLYLHSDVSLCDKTQYSCDPEHVHRRRREVSNAESSQLKYKIRLNDNK